MGHGGRLFQGLEAFGDVPALLSETGDVTTHAQLAARADAFAARADAPGLAVVICRNETDCVTAYVGLMRRGLAVMLLHQSIHPDHLAAIFTQFRPAVLAAPAVFAQGDKLAEAGQYGLYRLGHEAFPIHGDLALLLTTSGTTGSRNFVRLSRANLLENARSIVAYLGIGLAERAVTTMPLSYTFGLSILHSHLLAGASVVMTESSMVAPGFWNAVKGLGVTSLSGVPFLFDVLKKLRFASMDLPGLKTLTQAGGRLGPDLAAEFAQVAAAKGMRFVVMYGQTEATARMAYLPPDRTLDKPASIGIAIPGGRITLEGDDGAEIAAPGATGELIYWGPNVSLGYAQGADDLAKGDENNGRLATGDLGYRDEDGFFFLVGRKKRFIKMYGHRVGLDEVERILAAQGVEAACAGADNDLRIFVAGNAAPAEVKALVKAQTGLGPQGVSVEALAAIPRAESGKVDYAALAKRAGLAHG